jgi:hypothetical protein
MRRRTMACVLAVIAALATIAPAASARQDAGPQPIDIYLSQTDFSFTDDSGITFAGIAQVEDNRRTGDKIVGFQFNGLGAPEPCLGDITNDYIEFFAARSRMVFYRLESDLTHATVGLVLNGHRVRYDGCTGKLESRRPEVHTFGYELEPAATPVTTIESFCRDDGEGGMVEVTEIFTIADATGPAVLDFAPVTQTFGSLQHLEHVVGNPC